MPKSAAHVILELTAQACEPLTVWHQAHGSLRFAGLIATRLRNRPNGRVTIQLKAIDHQQYAVPEIPDILAHLSTIWDLPKCAVETRGVARGAGDIHANQQKPNGQTGLTKTGTR